MRDSGVRDYPGMCWRVLMQMLTQRCMLISSRAWWCELPACKRSPLMDIHCTVHRQPKHTYLQKHIAAHEQPTYTQANRYTHTDAHTCTYRHICAAHTVHKLRTACIQVHTHKHTSINTNLVSIHLQYYTVILFTNQNLV